MSFQKFLTKCQSITHSTKYYEAKLEKYFFINPFLYTILVVLFSAAECPQIHFTALAPGLIDTAMQTYISQLEPLPIYPTLKRLQSARGTADMPKPEEAAPKLAQAFEQVLSMPSGQYVDIRQLAQ